jgi:hypothetical protein
MIFARSAAIRRSSFAAEFRATIVPLVRVSGVDAAM